MSLAHKMNVMHVYTFGAISLVTSFILPAEIPVLALLLAYPHSIIATGKFIGLGRDWYDEALKLFYKLLGLTIAVFTLIYWRYGLVSDGVQSDISIFEALYFSITTWTTLGYGDFAPAARIRHITSIQAILGYVGMGVWIALINRYITIRAEVTKEINDQFG